MTAGIPVIDIFAGPGGLGEGFAALRGSRGQPIFRIALSIEKDRSARETLELRSFFRQFRDDEVPKEYYLHLQRKMSRGELFDLYPEQSRAANWEAWHLELGENNRRQIRRRIGEALRGAEQWVLIGGPPCQAYSLAGRSRNKGRADYDPTLDERQYLYEEYLQVIADHGPPVFVMENVKGLLSATLNNQRLFDRIVDDLHCPAAALARKGRAGRRRRHRYRICSLAGDDLFGGGGVADYVVRAEEFGIPQARHRVILLGIREDMDTPRSPTLTRRPAVPARKVLDGLAALRSGLSDQTDSRDAWISCLRDAITKRWLQSARNRAGSDVYEKIVDTVSRLSVPPQDRGAEYLHGSSSCSYQPEWFLDSRLKGICNHVARTHMSKDLHRYLYAAAYASVYKRSPRLADFPKDLLPNHSNVQKAVEGGHFNDRFRVQLPQIPARTVTSHIAKDGHYYIHYDPAQCRALTVREAARLQTFPDNYLFCGNRTSQYSQVGNAVPPLLALEIARTVAATTA